MSLLSPITGNLCERCQSKNLDPDFRTPLASPLCTRKFVRGAFQCVSHLGKVTEGNAISKGILGSRPVGPWAPRIPKTPLNQNGVGSPCYLWPPWFSNLVPGNGKSPPDIGRSGPAPDTGFLRARYTGRTKGELPGEPTMPGMKVLTLVKDLLQISRGWVGILAREAGHYKQAAKLLRSALEADDLHRPPPVLLGSETSTHIEQKGSCVTLQSPCSCSETRPRPRPS